MDNLTRAKKLYLDNEAEFKPKVDRQCILCGNDLLYYNKSVCNACQSEAKTKYENNK